MSEINYILGPKLSLESKLTLYFELARQEEIGKTPKLSKRITLLEASIRQHKGCEIKEVKR